MLSEHLSNNSRQKYPLKIPKNQIISIARIIPKNQQTIHVQASEDI